MNSKSLLPGRDALPLFLLVVVPVTVASYLYRTGRCLRVREVACLASVGEAPVYRWVGGAVVAGVVFATVASLLFPAGLARLREHRAAGFVFGPDWRGLTALAVLLAAGTVATLTDLASGPTYRAVEQAVFLLVYAPTMGGIVLANAALGSPGIFAPKVLVLGTVLVAPLQVCWLYLVAQTPLWAADRLTGLLSRSGMAHTSLAALLVTAAMVGAVGAGLAGATDSDPGPAKAVDLSQSPDAVVEDTLANTQRGSYERVYRMYSTNLTSGESGPVLPPARSRYDFRDGHFTWESHPSFWNAEGAWDERIWFRTNPGYTDIARGFATVVRSGDVSGSAVTVVERTEEQVVLRVDDREQFDRIVDGDAMFVLPDDDGPTTAENRSVTVRLNRSTGHLDEVVARFTLRYPPEMDRSPTRYAVHFQYDRWNKVDVSRPDEFEYTPTEFLMDVAGTSVGG